MTIDAKEQLAEAIDTFGLQDVLEAIADICNERSDRGAEWPRAGRMIREVAGKRSIEDVS